MIWLVSEGNVAVASFGVQGQKTVSIDCVGVGLSVEAKCRSLRLGECDDIYK